MSDQPSNDAPAYPPAYPPATPPAAEQPPVQPAAQPAAAPKKRKRHGCLITLLVVLGLIAALVVTGLVVISKAAKPRDLGVRYTEKDYWSAVEKAGVKLNEVPDAETWGKTDVVYSGSKKIDATFTEAEVSALFSYSHQSGWPVSDAQVRFTGGNGVEVSAVVEYAGAKYPVYVQGTAGISGKTMTGSITDAEVLGRHAPSQYYGAGASYALGFINSRLARLTGLDITTAEVTPEGLHLVGTVPANAERTPR